MSPTEPGRPRRVEKHAQFEELLIGLSSRFIDVPPDDVDREIEESLSLVCEHLGIDSAALWQWSGASPDLVIPTHVYPRPDGQRSFDPLSQESYPWVVSQMRAGCTVAVSGLDELPEEAAVDRESARRSGIMSNLCLPLLAGGGPPVGALAFNTLRVRRHWSSELVKRLQLVAQVFTNALVRKRADRRCARARPAWRRLRNSRTWDSTSSTTAAAPATSTAGFGTSAASRRI